MNLSQCFFMGVAFIMAVLMVALVPRLLSGPSTADRLVVLDTINTFVSGIMLLLGAVYDSVVMVDVAIAYMSLSFVSGLYIA